ncbi:hypothetical protein V1477_011975 [Vespula maculifrons]|uniref:Uncharacterized protein n=1 Tax=Vespula maculifrons TaxID=7453 RepID=A0ABD2C0Q9_VESMC
MTTSCTRTFDQTLEQIYSDADKDRSRLCLLPITPLRSLLNGDPTSPGSLSRGHELGWLDRVIASGVSRYEYSVPTDPRRKGAYDRPRRLIATKTKPLMPTDFQGVVTDNGKGRVGTALAVKQRSVPAPATLQRHGDGTIDGKLSRATKNES